MATATAAATAPAEVTSLADLREKHGIAQETKEQAWSAVAAAEVTLTELAATSRSVGTRVEILSARLAQQDADRRHDETLLAALRADQVESDLRDAVREAERRACFEEKRIIVPKLVKILLAARVEVDKLAAVQEREQNECGSVPDRIDWPSLQSSTPGFESHLDFWLEHLRENGLLDGIG